MNRTPVWSNDTAFAAALAQLPDRAERAPTPAGAVCVIDGRRERADRLRAVLAERPAAIVLTGGEGASPAVLDELALAELPVVVHRALLRHDDVDLVRTLSYRHVLVDAVGGQRDRRGLAAAVGWARVTAGSDLRVVSRARTSDSAVIAALESASGRTATVSWTQRATLAGLTLSVLGLSDQRLEVEIDPVAGIRVVRIVDDHGALDHAPRYEASERLALRRALAAIEGERPDDLGALRHDRAVAGSILGDGSA